MKMSVRLLTVAGLLVLALCLCLVGCDSDPAPSPETNGATETVSSPSTESATKGLDFWIVIFLSVKNSVRMERRPNPSYSLDTVPSKASSKMVSPII